MDFDHLGISSGQIRINPTSAMLASPDTTVISIVVSQGAAVTPTLTPQPVSGAGAAGTSTHAQATPDSNDDLAVLLNTDSSSNWRVKQPKLKTKDPDVQKELNELAGFKHTEYQLTLLSLLLDARKKELVISSGQRDLFAKDVVFAQANRRLQEQNRQNAEDTRLAAQDKAKLLS
ncbi:hypothetical protein SELMODRAFT_410203 [Selaginella moellendorffii]|uniref:Uncharacterized protein n=1 Tax=Selaginella moellendorffii TaxID=88036 RepID=D8RDZ3_SELML|nr:hypothetical protein SELMODRAFT_410203 [Selaginella moellendorffii]